MEKNSPSSKPRPTFNELLDFSEGRLSESDHQRVAELISAHAGELEADLKWVQDFLSKSRATPIHPLPAGLEERLQNLYARTAEKPLAEKVSGWMGTIRRVVAELVDPGMAPGYAAAGLRSKAFESTPRQWAFRTERCDIWINALARPDERYDLHGQIYSHAEEDPATGCAAQLLKEDRDFGLATVDDYGEFLIRNVPAGEYSLVIAGEESELVCSPVTFGD